MKDEERMDEYRNKWTKCQTPGLQVIYKDGGGGGALLAELCALY